MVLISIIIASLSVNFLVFAIQVIIMLRRKFLDWYYERLRKRKAPIEPAVPAEPESPVPTPTPTQPLEEIEDGFYAHHIDDDEGIDLDYEDININKSERQLSDNELIMAMQKRLQMRLNAQGGKSLPFGIR
jgi:hypothetical protein